MVETGHLPLEALTYNGTPIVTNGSHAHFIQIKSPLVTAKPRLTNTIATPTK